MHIACVKSNVSVIEVLLNARRYGCEPPDLDLKDARQRTPDQVAKGSAATALFANVIVKDVGHDDAGDDSHPCTPTSIRNAREQRCLRTAAVVAVAFSDAFAR
jgi:hypothetical protein